MRILEYFLKNKETIYGEIGVSPFIPKTELYIDIMDSLLNVTR